MIGIEQVLKTRHLLWYNFILWLTLCLFEIIKVYSFNSNFGYNFNPAFLIRWPISIYLTFWILSFSVFRIFRTTRRFNAKHFIAIHLVSGFLFGILFKLMAPLIGLLLERLFLETETLTLQELWNQMSRNIYDVLLGMAVYWGILMLLLGIDYYRKFQDQYAKSLELEKQLGVSQLQSMKMQLQPHFLFNAFNTIAMMVRQKKSKEAVVMINNLSDMLRQSLNKGTNQFVKLGDEIKLLEKYLSIESQRYKERLSVEWDLDEELNNQEIPSLILQPIVENAFKHGISKNIDTSILKISTRRKGDFIEMEVFNTGSTLPGRWNFQGSKGIGMANTASRLLKLYKQDFKFLINEREDGVSVSLLLPLRNGRKN